MNTPAVKPCSLFLYGFAARSQHHGDPVLAAFLAATTITCTATASSSTAAAVTTFTTLTAFTTTGVFATAIAADSASATRSVCHLRDLAPALLLYSGGSATNDRSAARGPIVAIASVLATALGAGLCHHL